MEEVKKSKKKNKVASLLLALALILTCGVAGTIAQYQKSFDGTATATVAKFDVTDNNTVQTNVTNLFKTVVDTKVGSDGTSYTEEDVATGTIAPGTAGFVKLEVQNDSEVSIDYTFTLDKVYASGKAAGEAGNGWEVNYTNKAGVKNTLGEIPLKFALYKGTEDLANVSTAKQGKEIAGITDWKDLSALSAGDLKGSITVNDIKNGTKSKNVYLVWQWAFGADGVDDDTNRLDTAIGEDMAGAKTINPQLKVTLKATQAD